MLEVTVVINDFVYWFFFHFYTGKYLEFQEDYTPGNISLHLKKVKEERVNIKLKNSQ